MWVIRGFRMKVTRWTPEFRPDIESPVVPVWITLDGLPLHLHDKRALFFIAGMIGKPLKVDTATSNYSRPSRAKVCVELDLLREIPSKMLIMHGAKEIIQSVTYEELPKYCVKCNKIGHSKDECGIPKPRVGQSGQQHAGQMVRKEVRKDDQKAPEKWVQVLRKKHGKDKMLAMEEQPESSKDGELKGPESSVLQITDKGGQVTGGDTSLRGGDGVNLNGEAGVVEEMHKEKGVIQAQVAGIGDNILTEAVQDLSGNTALKETEMVVLSSDVTKFISFEEGGGRADEDRFSIDREGFVSDGK
ncbi:unnamed protein product [Cuscuta europaea]|uniref:DUF4283 domain-containing protein n=1 Tax=Cuscuta europaea TaxID=41803 RepID=A0A9P1E966_CUSEU|nr:unnamed protein product [Cuscuta europaea]